MQFKSITEEFIEKKHFKSDIIGQKIGQNRTKSDKIERKIDLSSIEMLDSYYIRYISDFDAKNDFFSFLKFNFKN